MAIGRMINKHINIDKKVDSLSSDTCRLAFTWTIPHLDRDGRICGDPCVLKSTIFPRREDVTPEIMRGFIAEWAECGLVQWYRADGDLWLSFPGFRKNQAKLEYAKEAPSRCPAPDQGEQVASESRVSREQVASRSLPMEEKRREEKRSTLRGELAAPDPDILPFDELPQKPARTPQTAAVPAVATRPVYHLIRNAFTSKTQEPLFDFKREGPHIAALEKRALARDDPENFAKAFLVAYWRLTHSEDKFWRKQPWLPSVLNSGGIWPRVVKELENMSADHLDAETQELIRGLWK